jgi:Peptidase MA superfamily
VGDVILPSRRLLAVAAVCAMTLRLALVTGEAHAASTLTFGAVQATATFGVGVELSEPVTLPDGVRRIEAVVRIDSSTTRDVVDVDVPAPGATTLHYELETPPGAITPNTLLTLRFRVTPADGAPVLGPAATIRYADTRFDWKTMTGDVVRVHWVVGDSTFGRRALAIGDRAVAQVSQLLGVEETEPIDFFIYPDVTSFRQVLGPATRENVGGIAFPWLRTLLAQIGPDAVDDPWVGVVIPHELTHVVFATATDNPYHTPAHWVNEGLAVYESQGYDAGDRGSIARAGKNGSLMPLSSIAGQFPTTADRFGLAYSESVSAIDFLVRRYGQDALVALIRSFAGGRSDDEAFKAALGVDVAGFEAAWLADLGFDEPSPFGPKPAPPGPVPADWAGGAVVPGTLPGASPVATGSSASSSPVASPGATPASSLDGVLTSIVVGVLAGLVLIAALALWLRSRRRPGPAVPEP